MPPRLEQLLREADFHSQPVPFLLSLARHLSAAGAIDLAYQFLCDVQRARPNDYWANADLGYACLKRGLLQQARECATAMVALRPLEPSPGPTWESTCNDPAIIPAPFVPTANRLISSRPMRLVTATSAVLCMIRATFRAVEASQQAIKLRSGDVPG